LLCKRHVFASSFLLGIATLSKIYPIVLFPYWVLLAFRKRSNKNREITLTFLGYISGILVLALAHVTILGGSLREIWTGLHHHADKPLDFFSPLGTFTSLAYYLSHNIPPPIRYHLWVAGITDEALFLPKVCFLYFWVLPLTALYVLLTRLISVDDEVDALIIVTVLSVFLVSSSQVLPQYFYWMALFFPLLKCERKFCFFRRWSVGLMAFILGLTQILYPLNYNELIQGFFEKGENAYLFWILVVRSLTFVILSMLLVRWLFVARSNISQPIEGNC